VVRKGKKFRDIPWDDGETLGWLGSLFRIAGLGLLTGEGRVSPVLGEDVRWALEPLRKYPEPEMDEDERVGFEDEQNGESWVVVERGAKKDSIAFI
jgi:hypothetical protein